MIDRFAGLPSSLASQARFERLAGGSVPALLAHPDWRTPVPTIVWMHGRTASKEWDPGRYLRWIRAGMAACAVDLPGHGERLDRRLHQGGQTLYAVAQMVEEIDAVVESLADPRFGGAFDVTRLGIGGMSAGGMATLRRLGDPHPFRAASVESTAGDFSKMPYLSMYPRELVERLDPMRRVEWWAPVPLLALHSEADELTPVAAIRSFTDALGSVYARAGAPEGLARLVTWPTTGAPQEHSGFGRVANEAKNMQTEFFGRWLLGKE